jgi:hypothetical protein
MRRGHQRDRPEVSTLPILAKRIWSNDGQSSPIHLTVLIPLVLFLLWIWLGPGFLGSKRMDFEKHRAEVVITNSKVTYSKEADGNYVSTIGTLKNEGNLKWSPLHLEVQYFNQAGNLIDTQADKNYQLILLPHTEHSFRLRDRADKPESEYATHKVYLREAEDASRWP